MNKLKIIKTGKIFINLFIFNTFLFIYISCIQDDKNIIEYIDYKYEKYDNGHIESLGMYIDSVKQGLWINFHPNGQIKYINFFKDGKENGPFEIFYENGLIRHHRFMKNNLSNGNVISYYENGNVINESYFINDTIDGISKEYYENGEIYYIWKYDKGKFIEALKGPQFIPPVDEDNILE